jgi:hypothetical protein
MSAKDSVDSLEVSVGTISGDEVSESLSVMIATFHFGTPGRGRAQELEERSQNDRLVELCAGV